MNFTVYKSSAGSGKTYTLVKEYLKIVLRQPSDYRHALAITFTNKAANEMKTRIVNVLRTISRFEDDANGNAKILPLLNDLERECGLDQDALVKNARTVLNSIIHNYSEFAVSTIDSFIHRVIKSFAFDLNVPINFEVEIDTDEVLKKVIDLMISKVGSDPDLTRFLVEYVQSRADEEKNWNIEADLHKVARLLKKEDSLDYLQLNAGLELNDYMAINVRINKFIARFEAGVRELAAKAMEIIDSRGVPQAAFYYGDRGIYGYFSNLANRRFDMLNPNSYVLKTVAEDKWASGKATVTDLGDIEDLKPDLLGCYRTIQELIEKDSEDYRIFQEIRKTIHPLAILGKINEILAAFKSENNILLIAEFNQLVAEIVLDEPVPFIYERVGEKYRYFLLDEFQDTSVLQWQNLLPLIDNSLAQGFSSLVVGDAKQAIYRWRNGEVEQFVSLPSIFNRKEGQVHQERELALTSNYLGLTLKSNYRSLPGIVSFNNDFFRFMTGQLSENEARIYEGVEQEQTGDREGGYVQLEFYPPGTEDASFEEFNCTGVKEKILESRALGYRNKDIAILCRANRSASIIANYLLGEQIQVVSSESMLLEGSPRVRLLVALLNIIADPGNDLASVEVINLLLKSGKIGGEFNQLCASFLGGKAGEGDQPGKSNIFVFLRERGIDLHHNRARSLPLYDLCEHLMRVTQLLDGPDPFIQFFLDTVLEHEKEIESGISKFLEFWERKKNSLSIIVPEGLDAVRIMTIHKAKGLEFPVVIYPFVQEPLKKTLDTVWLNLDHSEVPTLKAVLVNANKTIQESRYGELVTRELEKSRLDLVNLLYVAFTRPTDQLYVLANHPENMWNAAGSVPVMLIDYLKEKGIWDESVFRYEFGQRKDVERTTPGKDIARKLSGGQYPDWRSRALISYQAPSNWEVEEPEKRQEWGNMIHRILSEIRIREDLEVVLDQYLYNGIIGKQEHVILLGIIKEFLDRPDVTGYFKPGLSVINEREIITPDGHVYRPDRIVIEGSGVVVIDFKTGIPMDKHRAQMEQYVRLMSEMNWQEPRGVVLYLDHPEPLYVS